MQERKPLTAKTRSGRPSRQETEEIGLRIIETATHLFATQGFAGTSVEQVAAHCGTGKDTIYRRFPSKVALFHGVVKHAHGRVTDRIRDISFTETDPMIHLKELLRCFLSINMEHDLIALKRINFSEVVASGRKVKASPRQDPLMDMLNEAVKTGQSAGVLREGDPALISAWLIHSVVSIPTTDAMLGGTEYADPAALDAYFNAVWPWLMKGIAAE